VKFSAANSALVVGATLQTTLEKTINTALVSAKATIAGKVNLKELQGRVAVIEKISNFIAFPDVDAYRPANRDVNIDNMTAALSRAMDAAVESCDFKKTDVESMKVHLNAMASSVKFAVANATKVRAEPLKLTLENNLNRALIGAKSAIDGNLELNALITGCTNIEAISEFIVSDAVSSFRPADQDATKSSLTAAVNRAVLAALNPLIGTQLAMKRFKHIWLSLSRACAFL